jgi:folate-binding protein YgfZ
VPAGGLDAGIAWHYGDPVAERKALNDGRAFVDQSNLGVITVTGADRLTWLHSLMTQDLASLNPEHSVEAMVLNPQGRIEHVASVVDDGSTTWLITTNVGELLHHLERMRFTLRVDVTDASDEWVPIADTAFTPLPFAGPPPWVDPWPGVVEGGTSYSGIGPHPGDGWRWRLSLVSRQRLATAITDLRNMGLQPVGTWAAESARIGAWRPRAATEVDSTSLPHEFDWLRTAVHLKKGCYRGQETVAKVHNVGRPPRRLVFLHLDGSGHVLPERQASISLGDDVVGHVTSVALDFESGPIALALVKRAIDSSATLTVARDGESISATQVEIVGTAGVSIDRPAPRGPTAKGLLVGNRCTADGGDLPLEAEGGS